MNEDFKTKITIFSYDTKISWEPLNSNGTAKEMIEGVVSCLLGLTYTKESIISAMKNYIEEC